MSKILIISGHPDLNQSIVNKRILAGVEAELGSDVSVRRLSEIAPEGKFDVAAEQAALVAADVIVLQFPIFWYNAPSLLRKWMEDVLLYGFAYGSTGTALQGKKFIISATAGGQEVAYNEVLPYNLKGIMTPFQNSAVFMGMQWQEAVLSAGALNNPTISEEENLKVLVPLAENHVARLVATIKSAL